MKISRSLGFNLIELMIVLATIAILAAIAYPNYAAYGFRSRRADGREMIMRVATAQERYYTTFNAYTTDLTKLNFASATDIPSENGNYTIASANGSTGNAQSFTITGTPVGTQARDSCKELVLTSVGIKSAPSDTGANGKCW